MKISGEGFLVQYDPEQGLVICSGLLDLRGKEGYGPVSRLLDQAVEDVHPQLTLDLTGLEFLNSSGITTLGGFIIKLRNRGISALRIRCSSDYTWQPRSMRGLQKLMPDMALEFDGPVKPRTEETGP